MATRQIVSYDDITLPYGSSADRHASDLPPPKKRKKNNQKAKQVNSSRQPSDGPTIPKNRGSTAIEVDTAECDEEESRELNHEEIWDDSALVDAWEAAQQEYEMYHGKGKDWKNEPVKKSPLWYNVPVEQTAKKTDVLTAQSSTGVAQSDNNIEPVESDSQPLNFDTFVPTHDPSLQLPSVYPPSSAPGAHDMVSQDEAFSRAMTAMYWGGYWTAMYHCQQHLSNPKGHDTGENGVDDGEVEDETEEET